MAATSAALVLTACGQDDSGGADSAKGDSATGKAGKAGSREERYKRVIEDPHPRPAEVIWAAGAPTGVARANDGSLLLTYDAGNVEDDEGPAASAWRVVDPRGRTVAEHAEHTDAEAVRPQFKGVRGGFVSVPAAEGTDGVYGIGVHGERHKVTTTETALGSRPGDILVAELEPALIYRPATRTAAPPAGVPDDARHLAVDERGTTWILDQPLTAEHDTVVRQREGRTLGSTPVPKQYQGGKLTARGGTAALALLQEESVRGLLVTTDGGAHWTTLTGGGVPWQDLKRGPEFLVLQALSDGRLIVGEEGGRQWIADDRTNRTFHALKTPKDFTSFAVHGTALYGIVDTTTATYDLADGEGLWTSRDAGRTWQRYEQRG
ncbi:hypothetical protein [Streptomyces sp. MZ04]|uniref:hypothetical protein n=1 Tax=Streptomyces sp. MZ04 TaxID=2559236 RepID=UPI001FD78E5B|nr:hypothetical protein [Streptomyces sp. MZ04]